MIPTRAQATILTLGTLFFELFGHSDRAAAFLLLPQPPAQRTQQTPPAATPPSAQKGKAATVDQEQHKELVDPNICRSIDQMGDRDGDFARNRQALSNPDLCLRKVTFQESGLRWTFQVIENRQNPSRNFWFVPHDNENAAFDTAIYGVGKYGGVAVAIETGGERNNGNQDPNRNFDAGVANKCPQQIARSPIFTGHVGSFLRNNPTIIALHTNVPGPSISMKTPGGNPFFARPPVLETASNDDTMVFVASTAAPARDPSLMRFVNAINNAGVNVIFETVAPSRNDCSMSNYAALKGIRNYVNLEVLQGDAVGQRRMLDRLWPVISAGVPPLVVAPEPDTGIENAVSGQPDVQPKDGLSASKAAKAARPNQKGANEAMEPQRSSDTVPPSPKSTNRPPMQIRPPGAIGDGRGIPDRGGESQVDRRAKSNPAEKPPANFQPSPRAPVAAPIATDPRQR